MLVKSILNEMGDKSVLSTLTPEEDAILKQTLLEMCVDVMRFCEQNELICVLGGGTALGAIRHKGFIPWDDDVDLNMPRCDYNKFISLFPEAFGNKYELYVPDGTHQATTLSMKIAVPGTILEDIFHAGDPIKIGINIDIFPIENVPDNPIAATIKGFISDIYQKAVVSSYYYQCRSKKMKKLFSGSIKTRAIYNSRCFLGWLMSWKSYQWWYAKYDRFVQEQKETARVTIPTGQKHYFGEMMYKEDLFPLRRAEFEGHNFYVYRRIEKYLERLYGNYMELPPEDKRERHMYTNIQLPT